MELILIQTQQQQQQQQIDDSMFDSSRFPNDDLTFTAMAIDPSFVFSSSSSSSSSSSLLWSSSLSSSLCDGVDGFDPTPKEDLTDLYQTKIDEHQENIMIDEIFEELKQNQQEQQSPQDLINLGREVVVSFAPQVEIIPLPSPIDSFDSMEQHVMEQEKCDSNNYLWYGIRELYRFRSQARRLCRDLRDSSLRQQQHKQRHKQQDQQEQDTPSQQQQQRRRRVLLSSSSRTIYRGEETRGLEQRACLERQRRKYLTVKRIVADWQRRKQHKQQQQQEQQHGSMNDPKDSSFMEKQNHEEDTRFAEMAQRCSRWAVKLALEEAKRDYDRAYASSSPFPVDIATVAPATPAAITAPVRDPMEEDVVVSMRLMSDENEEEEEEVVMVEDAPNEKKDEVLKNTTTTTTTTTTPRSPPQLPDATVPAATNQSVPFPIVVPMTANDDDDDERLLSLRSSPTPMIPRPCPLSTNGKRKISLDGDVVVVHVAPLPPPPLSPPNATTTTTSNNNSSSSDDEDSLEQHNVFRVHKRRLSEHST